MPIVKWPAGVSMWRPEDIIHLPFRPKITEVDYQDYKVYQRLIALAEAALKRGNAPLYYEHLAEAGPYPLTPEQRKILQVAQEKAILIAQSPSPEWRRNWVRVMTWLDNIEDLTTSLTVAGSLAARWVPWMKYPVVGLLAVDTVLEFATALARLPNPGSLKKLKLYAAAAASPKLMRHLLLKNPRVLGQIATVGEWLEIGQTTDWLFGFGISLGPIFGGIEDTLTRLAAGLGLLPQARDITNEAMKGWRAMEAASQLVTPGTGMTQEERMAIAIAVSQFATAPRYDPRISVPADIPGSLQDILTRNPPVRTRTRLETLMVADDAGITDQDQLEWINPGGVTEYDLRDHSRAVQRNAQLWIEESFDLLDGDWAKQLFGLLISTAATDLVDFAEGSTGWVKSQPAPDIIALGERLRRGETELAGPAATPT